MNFTRRPAAPGEWMAPRQMRRPSVMGSHRPNSARSVVSERWMPARGVRSRTGTAAISLLVTGGRNCSTASGITDLRLGSSRSRAARARSFSGAM
ncbi:MAG: hypothetical protein SFV51_05280 [Bryobacteraceae bacterium]|nr:hypothetical protein [Bryobacteraceae bacterium]